jgi:flagellar protein FlaI
MLQALDIVCIQTISRAKDKRARKCKQIIEIVDIDPATKEILTNEVFHWDSIEDKFIYSGKSYILERIRTEKDLSGEEIKNEIKQRAALLEWMRKKNITGFKEVAAMAANYVENPLEIMKKVKEDN